MVLLQKRIIYSRMQVLRQSWYIELLDKDKITKEIAEVPVYGNCTRYGNLPVTPVHRRRHIAWRQICWNMDLMLRHYHGLYITCEKTYAQNQMMGRALLESILFMDGRCIASSFRKEQMDYYGVTPKDLDGIVSAASPDEGCGGGDICSMRLTADVYKVSLRSKSYVDVSKVASYFGGGGHVRAAGCTMPGTIYDVLNNLSGRIEMQMRAEK